MLVIRTKKEKNKITIEEYNILNKPSREDLLLPGYFWVKTSGYIDISKEEHSRQNEACANTLKGRLPNMMFKESVQTTVVQEQKMRRRVIGREY